jgi:hypothetical protein
VLCAQRGPSPAKAASPGGRLLTLTQLYLPAPSSRLGAGDHSTEYLRLVCSPGLDMFLHYRNTVVSIVPALISRCTNVRQWSGRLVLSKLLLLACPQRIKAAAAAAVRMAAAAVVATCMSRLWMPGTASPLNTARRGRCTCC